MENGNTLLRDNTIDSLRKLLRNFDKINSSIDIYTLFIDNKKKEEKKE